MKETGAHENRPRFDAVGIFFNTGLSACAIRPYPDSRRVHLFAHWPHDECLLRLRGFRVSSMDVNPLASDYAGSEHGRSKASRTTHVHDTSRRELVAGIRRIRVSLSPGRLQDYFGIPGRTELWIAIGLFALGC